ncbi:ATPase [Inconstantimicrobium mannanitabidum]|uniref:Uncharacterized protein n=1 Tax=Inconstantimicrobium mannanitabidum TaxID=1604901 RepID=A0ACB5RAP8_9CLOT|nr:ATPase [Clostridium sp. TW13]GKX66270.1 hypothetical protein rsdtw13_15280 [Clostridium sp. TW13]
MNKSDRMDIVELLEYLQDLIENSSKVPITGKVILDKKEILEVIEQIINYLPDEFKKAQWVMGEKDRILSEAKKEHETIKAETLSLMKKQVENHDIVKEAQLKAQDIITQAQREAKEMRLGARDYADEVLSQLENEINQTTGAILNKIKIDVEGFATQFSDDMSKTSGSIRKNIKELRDMK